MASVLNQNSARATLYLYLSTSPRLLSHLGFLFKQPLPIVIAITSFLNKTGLLGQEIHCQSPSYHWVTVSEHQAISIGASERHKSHHSVSSSASARHPNAHTGPRRRNTPYSPSSWRSYPAAEEEEGATGAKRTR